MGSRKRKAASSTDNSRSRKRKASAPAPGESEAQHNVQLPLKMPRLVYIHQDALIDSRVMLQHGVTNTIKKFRPRRTTFPTAPQILSAFETHRNLEDIWFEFGVGARSTPKHVADWTAEFARLYDTEGVDLLTVYPKTRELLAEFEAHNVPVIVAVTNNLELVDHVLKEHDLLGLVASYVKYKPSYQESEPEAFRDSFDGQVKPWFDGELRGYYLANGAAEGAAEGERQPINAEDVLVVTTAARHLSIANDIGAKKCLIHLSDKAVAEPVDVVVGSTEELMELLDVPVLAK
ncbi:hypothetical protein B0T17DRAFT_503909 [Bombardia bombarda]|uniref:Uncharacterized protein n=1 Tax=Bombardia bombarda TaxID=252184 RepID=A0AA39XMR9_9PEZI|nr:hypothetical protein B0T17DRAFT_503909 [Bombardia bombarda]